MDVPRGDRSQSGDSSVVTIFLAGCYTSLTVAALIMGYDGYLVLAAGTFLGGFFSWELKSKIDKKELNKWKFLLQEQVAETTRILNNLVPYKNNPKL